MRKASKYSYSKVPVYTYRRPYPNAADPGYFAEKVVDGILSAAAAMGTLTILFFLITM